MKGIFRALFNAFIALFMTIVFLGGAGLIRNIGPIPWWFYVLMIILFMYMNYNEK
jgi:hypothetical protein